jgi:hypothetical protein
LRFVSIANDLDCKLFLLKPLAEGLRQGGVFFRDKDSHRLTL